MARKILRQVDSFGTGVIADSTQVRRTMPLGTTVSRYFVRFTATFVVGTAALTAVNEDSPYGYLRSIDAIINGSFPLRGNVDGRGFFFFNRLQAGTPPQSTAPGTAVGTYSIVSELSVDMSQIDLIPPLDAAFWLDTRLLSRLELVYLFGVGSSSVANAFTDLGQNSATSTQTLSAQSIVVYAEEVADAGGFLSRMQQQRIKVVPAGTGDNDIQLPALGPAYRGIAVHATSGNATEFQATSDDTIINTVSLIGDNVVRHLDQSPYRALRQDNKVLYSLETMPPGWLFLDFARSKNLKDLIYTSRTRQLVLRINIASLPANSILQVYPWNALLVIRNPQAARAVPVGGAAVRR